MMNDSSYKDKIDAWVDAHQGEMIEDIKELVRIPSVKGEALDGRPFGQQPANALEAMRKLMEKYGLRVTNYDNYCVTGDLSGENDKELDILAHLDVVPVSDTWTVTSPFDPVVNGDRIYGRGTSDDKGPAVAALYSLRAINELNIPLRAGVRLICGSDEECGSSDLRYYYTKEKEAKYTFSPDADYPLINVERAQLQKHFSGKGAQTPLASGKTRVLSFESGTKANVIPGKAAMLLAGADISELEKAVSETERETSASFTVRPEADGKTRIEISGRTGHAAYPDGGAVNSLTAALTLLGRLDLADRGGENSLLSVAGMWPFGDNHGDALGVHYEDEKSGLLTMSLDILRYETSEDESSFSLEGCFDCRAPICADDDNLTKKISRQLEDAGLDMEKGGMIPAHYVSADSELVRRLLESYELYFGKPGEPVAIGGGTYVHDLERGVAFGCAVPGVDNHMHGDDEFAEISVLTLSAKIFADAILRLCG